MKRAIPDVSFRSSVRRELVLGAGRRPRSARSFGLVAAVLLWGLASGPAAAGPRYQQELVPGFSSLVVGLNASPKLADLDGDGDPDAVVGENYGSLRYFENTGSSTAPAFVERIGATNPFDGIDTGDRSDPELADLDGDGDLDAVIGEGQGSLLYFENTGSSAAPAFVQRVAGANPFDGIDVGLQSSPDLVDLDGDGDLDAVVGEFLGGLRYFENTGSSTAPVFLERVGAANPVDGVDVSSRSRPELVDLDGDGDLDAVVGEISGNLRFFANTGSSLAAVFVEQTGGANPFNAVDVGSYADPALVDLDGDGDLDGVVGENQGSLRFLANTGSSSAPGFTDAIGSANPLAGLSVGGYSSLELVDLDGDGDLDGVSGAISGGLRFFANTGSASAPAFVAQTGTANPFDGIALGANTSPVLADLDGDGDRDAVVGDDYGGLSYLANTGTSSTPAFVERTGTANPFSSLLIGRYYRPALVDLDADGDFDAVVGDLYGRLRYYENTGSSSAPAFVSRSGTANPLFAIDVGYSSNPDLVDLDADGDFDVVVGKNYGILQTFENTGSAVAPAFAELTGTANPFAAVGVGGYSDPDFADLDGDGDFDLVVGEAGGRFVFFRAVFALFADGFESGDFSAWSAAVP